MPNSKEDQARIWNVRKVGLGLLDSRPQSERPAAFIEDCAIPVQRLGEFVREVEKILSAHGTEGGIYAHASAGCLHIRPILDLKTARGVGDLRAISEAVFALTVELGGAMSSEHGDGLARSEFLEQTVGPELMEAMRLLKRAADPDCLLNPGKILDAPKMDKNLRYGTRLCRPGVGDQSFLCPQRWPGCGDRAVQRPGRMPKRYRRDVPVLSGNPRGDAFHARPGQFAAGDD